MKPVSPGYVPSIFPTGKVMPVQTIPRTTKNSGQSVLPDTETPVCTEHKRQPQRIFRPVRLVFSYYNFSTGNTDWQHTVSLSTGPAKARDWAEEYVLCCRRVLCRWPVGYSLVKILTTKASRSSVKWMSCSRETSSRTTIWPPYLTLHVTDYGTWTIHAYHIYVYIEICLYKKTWISNKHHMK